MTESRTFDPGVRCSAAVLPDPPDLWSYSSLKVVESCPRRYVLGRSKYPDLWDRQGYPEVPNSAALFGDVVHDSLEAIVRALTARGCTSARASEAVEVLKELGGYTEIAKQMLARRLSLLHGNPRVSKGDLDRLTDALEHRIPEAREEVQRYLHRTTFTPVHGRAPGEDSAGGSTRRARGVGTHPEATLQADELRLWGRIDLLDVGVERVHITDYKTGVEDESHMDQLRFYSVLWAQDSMSNEGRKPVGTLTASYSTRSVTIDAPDPAAMDELTNDLRARVDAADARVLSAEPAAQTGEHCAFCSVRPLCSAYWRTRPDPAHGKDGSWFDFEGTVVERNGLKSWWLRASSSAQTKVLLRTTSALQEFEVGNRLRLLGLRCTEDPETEALVAVFGQRSEVFVVVDEGDF